jgi:hypothetical protein
MQQTITEAGLASVFEFPCRRRRSCVCLMTYCRLRYAYDRFILSFHLLSSSKLSVLAISLPNFKYLQAWYRVFDLITTKANGCATWTLDNEINRHYSTKIQFVPHREHNVLVSARPIRWTPRTWYRELMVVHCKNYIKHGISLCGQIAKYFMVNLVVRIVTTWLYTLICRRYNL